MRMKRFFLIALALLVVDWVLGALRADALFFVVNFPFGLPHVWLESHWMGTHYEIAGNPVSETWSFVTFFFAVVAQAALYSLVAVYWRRLSRPTRAAQDDMARDHS